MQAPARRSQDRADAAAVNLDLTDAQAAASTDAALCNVQEIHDRGSRTCRPLAEDCQDDHGVLSSVDNDMQPSSENGKLAKQDKDDVCRWSFLRSVGHFPSSWLSRSL